MDNPVENQNDISQSKFWGSIQWAILLITLAILINFVIRPSSFLRQGLVSNIQPDYYFIVVNDIFIIANIVGIFVTSFYLIQQYKTLISSLIYYIIYTMIITLSIINIVILSVYASKCNTIDFPNNPCNSDNYCCKYGASISECQSNIFPAPICNIPISILNNLKANDIFIEYFVWICIILLFNGLTIYAFWNFVNSLNIEMHGDNMDSNDELGQDTNFTNTNITSNMNNSTTHPILLNHNFYSGNTIRNRHNTHKINNKNDPSVTELVHTLSKKLYSYSRDITSKITTTLDNKYKNYSGYKKQL